MLHVKIEWKQNKSWMFSNSQDSTEVTLHVADIFPTLKHFLAATEKKLKLKQLIISSFASITYKYLITGQRADDVIHNTSKREIAVMETC